MPRQPSGPSERACAGGRRCRSERGAVFLLAVYFVSLMMLLVSGVALSRTTTEMSAVQLSRDREMAFFLAEAGIDQTLTLVRGHPQALASGLHTLVTPSGTIAYWASIVETQRDYTQGTIRRTHRILSTGCPTGKACPASTAATPSAFLSSCQYGVVEAFLETEEQLTGRGLAYGSITLGGLIVIGNSDPDRTWTTVRGQLQLTNGKRFMVQISPNTVVQGPILVNPADPPASDGYLTLISRDVNEYPAVLLGSTFFRGHLAVNPGDFAVQVADPPSRSYADAYPHALAPTGCQATPISVASGTTSLDDGGALDLDPTPGRVTVCVPYVEVEEGATLDAPFPTTLYVTDQSSRYLGTSFANWGTVTTAPGNHTLPSRGLTVVDANLTQQSAVLVGNFQGSVYNPSGEVLVGYMPGLAMTTGAATSLPVGYVVGYIVHFGGAEINFQTPSGTATSPIIRSWRDNISPTSGVAPPPPRSPDPPPSTAVPPGTGPPPGTDPPPGT